MKIEIATLFPEMCETVLSESIIGRARKKGAVDISCRNIREYTNDKHRRVDDTPYGGGMGMVMQADPIFNCYSAVCDELGEKPHTIYMSPKGRIFTQARAVELASYKNILIICGHYEGVDQRVIDEIVDEEISIGDYVLTGGELPALVVADAVSRMCEGVLSDELCYKDESHFNGLLEYPQYTRPEEWHGVKVPEVLLSGHHKNIEKFRLEKSLEITANQRPDMYEKYIETHNIPSKK
ncbi:MAG: tRNA (guanosine(37)-N1)-methyltransferase TrmD [Ruminococcus sp.]|nr:tRNA (guanosine(37)-N1)-methyltransferase TrmD [Ruminococcus sp.]